MVIGHTAQLERLKELARTDKLSHGYIFFGEPSIGKRACAEAFARFLETGDFSSASLRPLSDVHVIAPNPETQIIGIDAIREMRNFLAQKPNVSRYRTLIIDDAHTLTGEAAPALLKITEEPPSSALIILIAPDHEMLLPTIQSRVEKFYFSPVEEKEIAQWLLKDCGASKEEASRVASRAFGAPGVAWKLLNDQRFKKLHADAKKFFALHGKERRDFIKELTAQDDDIPPEDAFHFDRFLEALMREAMPLSAKNTPFFSACLKLREQADYFNLNPRLQLTALAQLS